MPGGNYHKDYHDLTKYNRTWIDKGLKTVAWLKIIALYNQLRLDSPNRGKTSSEKLQKIAKEVYPNLFEKTPKLAEKKVMSILKTKEVKEVADKSLIELLTLKGITRDWLVDRRLDIANRAKDQKKLETELKALEGFEDMHKLMARATLQQTESTDFDYSKFLANKTVKTIEIEGDEAGIKQLSEAITMAESTENEEKQAISLKQIKNDAHRCAVSEDNVPGNDKVCPLSSC